MKKHIYICPETGSELILHIELEKEGIIKKGFYISNSGQKYPIKDDIPDFTYPKTLSETQYQQFQYYENNASSYDDVQGLTFLIQNEDESLIRKKMISPLELKSNSKVLELCCGTGNDSINIASALDKDGEFYVQDLSGAMLRECQKKLKHVSVPTYFSIGNATHLAFPDNNFDALFCFGGLNVVDDIKRSLQEMVRVTKPNGRIVVGDESLPPWLNNTEFGKILLHSNPLFRFKLPLEAIPIEARDVTIKWIIGGVYYLISFTVGIGEPVANFDLEIPGLRGGTLKTRYAGQLEGVTEETKKLVLQAAKKSNKSIHQWLDQVLRDQAKNLL